MQAKKSCLVNVRSRPDTKTHPLCDKSYQNTQPAEQNSVGFRELGTLGELTLALASHHYEEHPQTSRSRDWLWNVNLLRQNPLCAVTGFCKVTIILSK